MQPVTDLSIYRRTANSYTTQPSGLHLNIFFYDNELQLHINDQPLLISSKIQKAAKKIGINLTWDRNGYIHQVSYDEVKLLSNELGIVMLSVRDYMNLVKREPKLASPDFAEWLGDTYTLSPENRMMDSEGQLLNVPSSRPGWFELAHVGNNGLPTNLSSLPGTGKWKFWTQSDSSFTAGAVRSFVTSSGTCSLDLGIPSFARHPNFMIRECYRSKPPSIENPLDKVWAEYEERTLSRNDKNILEFFKALDPNTLPQPSIQLDEFVAGKNKERVVDLIGKKRLIEGNFAGLRAIDLKTIATTLASKPDADTIYVTGHSQPDADAIVSAVFEATGRHIFYEKDCVAWSQRLPNVVRHILGK